MKREEKKVKVESSDDDEGHKGDEMSEEELNWWEQENIKIATRGEKRWDSLIHNGVMFPPEYVPHGIPIQYDGVEFKMTPEEEEVATMYAVMKETDYYKNMIFCRNFFRSWREVLDKRDHPIRELGLCNFEPIYQWHMREREKKLSRTKEEKKAIKEAADAEAEPYRYCLWDGRREQVANFRVEPPGLFRGRGKHPLMGKLKVRVQSEDVTINISADAEVPAPPPGHKWGSVQHDNTVTWLAMWRDSVAGNFKYVMLAPSSTVKGQSDMLKFEKARKLKDEVDRIRSSYKADLDSRDTHVAQRAVAMYFIDKLALRVGNEKGSDEADTVGCCSLRVEHIELLTNNVVKFDFLGKDSIRYVNEVKVHPQVHTLLRKFMQGKRRDMDIFDQLTPTQLNDHLKSFMDGLSAKVFRTYNASITLDRWFKETPVDPQASIPDKLAYFNKANTEVAILCNHQKSVSKNFRSQMAQLDAKASYTRKIIEHLEIAQHTMKTKSAEVAAKAFFAEMDRIQNEWLDAYGTEEQKREFAEILAKRGAPKVRSSSTSPSKKKKSASSSAASGSQKTKAGSPVKKSAKKSTSKPSKTKASPKKKQQPTKGEVSSDDETLASMASPKARVKRPRSGGTGNGAKKAKVEDNDDDDIPLAAL